MFVNLRFGSDLPTFIYLKEFRFWQLGSAVFVHIVKSVLYEAYRRGKYLMAFGKTLALRMKKINQIQHWHFGFYVLMTTKNCLLQEHNLWLSGYIYVNAHLKTRVSYVNVRNHWSTLVKFLYAQANQNTQYVGFDSIVYPIKCLKCQCSGIALK